MTFVLRSLAGRFIAIILFSTLGWAQNIVYTANTLAGQTRPTGDGAAATLALFNRPGALCYDFAGNLYIADQANFRVRKIDTTGRISTVAGTGTYGYSGDGGPGTSALIGTPQALAADVAGNLYIADGDWNVVRMISAKGVITTFAGNGTAGYSGNNGPATSASLNGPSGLAVDSAGNLYIADTYNNRVRKVSGGVISPYAGSGANSINALAGTALSSPLSTPTAMVFDSLGNLYVSSSAFATVLQITPGGVLSLFAGRGFNGFSDGDNGPATSAHFLSPSALATDTNGNLFIADDVAQVVRKVNSGGGITGIAGMVNTPGFGGDGGASTAAFLFSPSGLAVDKQGNVLVADYGNNRIRRIDPVSLTINTVAGTDTKIGDSGPGASAQLLSPRGTAVDGAGNTYIADTWNHRIRKVDSAGNISTFAGTGLPGRSGDGGLATNAQLLRPYSVAVDASGNVLIADTGNNKIRRVAPSGNITTVAGTGTYGFVGDGGLATQAMLAAPECVRTDANGNIFIVDTGNSRIRKINVSGQIGTVAGGNGTTFGDGGPAVSAQLSLPKGVAIDAAGNLYIADTFASAVRKVGTNGTINTVAGNGKFGFSGDGGAATSANLSFPYDVQVDATGNLYIADTLNARIRKVNTSGNISTMAGTGGFGTSGDGGPATLAQVGEASGLAVDAAGNVIFADSYNNRVRKLTAMAAAAADFTLTQDASLKSVTAGSDVSFSLAVTSQNGFVGPVTFAATGLANATVAYTPGKQVNVASGQSVLVIATVSVAANAAAGNQIFSFTATSGPLTHTLSTTLVVTGTGPAPPAITSAGVANGASFTGGPVAPGEIVTIYGSGFGPASIATLQLDAAGNVVSTLAGTVATFNNVPAPVIYVVAGQMSVVVPYALSGSSSATLKVTYNGVASNTVNVPVVDASPALFTYNTSGNGPLAALNQDGSVNTEANPAAAGSVMVFFGTGEGQTSPAGVDGQVATSVYPKPVLPVSAKIGGLPATVLYYGAAPNDVAGAFQLNLTVPTGVQSGPAVPVTFTVGTKTSQAGVTIAVK